MKALLAICMLLVAPSLMAADDPARTVPSSTVVKGEVLEVTNVDSYTYLRLKTNDGETWAAVSTAPIKKGDVITIENVMLMENFESKSLKKTFPVILFGALQGAVPDHAGYDMATPHAVTDATAGSIDIHVPKAGGADARTVAEVVAQAVAMKDKPVLVSGKVVKYNAGIMGKNWLHLRDGSGSAADHTNDILVTTNDTASVGDVVTAKGIVRNDKDFGAGYSYKVLIEEATLSR